MEIFGDRKFVELPGDVQHELPPLLVRTRPGQQRASRVVGMAAELVDAEEMIAPSPLDDLASELEVDRRKMDLALNLVDQYNMLLDHWRWGDSILEWIRQCETTFELRVDLRNLLKPDVWPHAGRCSFVRLLQDKSVPTEGVALEKAVGMRLTFRQPPPLSCFSDQFLFYLNGSVATTAYRTWQHMCADPVSSLPPERFRFQVLTM